MWTFKRISKMEKYIYTPPGVQQYNLKGWVNYFLSRWKIKIVQAATIQSAVFADHRSRHHSVRKAQMLELCTHTGSAEVTTSLFAFHNKNWPHPPSHSDPMNARTISLSLHTQFYLYRSVTKVRMRRTEDIWFPWCHSLPDVTGWGVEVQRQWLFNDSFLQQTLNDVFKKVHAKFSMKII